MKKLFAFFHALREFANPNPIEPEPPPLPDDSPTPHIAEATSAILHEICAAQKTAAVSAIASAMQLLGRRVLVATIDDDGELLIRTSPDAVPVVFEPFRNSHN